MIIDDKIRELVAEKLWHIQEDFRKKHHEDIELLAHKVHIIWRYWLFSYQIDFERDGYIGISIMDIKRYVIVYDTFWEEIIDFSEKVRNMSILLPASEQHTLEVNPPIYPKLC